MSDKHLSSQFDSELSTVSSRVMEMGGLVESQIRTAVYALAQFSVESADQVFELETRVNAMEVDIDRELSSIIARRQPTARDLRLLIAISKTTANLERAGDEAEQQVGQPLRGGGDTREQRAAGQRVHQDRRRDEDDRAAGVGDDPARPVPQPVPVGPQARGIGTEQHGPHSPRPQEPRRPGNERGPSEPPGHEPHRRG